MTSERDSNTAATFASHTKEKYMAKAIFSFLIVLLLMPMGHALMILMEHFLDETALHFSAFTMGFAGMLVVIIGIFVRGDTKQTIFGLSGGMLFWTGWVEFLFAYYAWRYGVHCDLVGNGMVQTTTLYADGIGVTHDFLINGQPLDSFSRPELKLLRGSRPEYLILPATFGMWMMLMMLYLFCTSTGCRFFCWIQKHAGIRQSIEVKPMTHLPSMTTFLELNLLMWSCYLLLMFCYDPIFLGSSHPVTFAVGIGCLVASLFMFKKQLRIRRWGANIRFSIATVIVFWTFVEVVARNGLLNEIWVDPMGHIVEMAIITATFVALILGAILKRRGTSAPSCNK